MIAYIKDDVLNKSFIQAVCIKYDGKYEPIEFLPLSSYNQSVNETKPTISKMESVDNYRDMWQKLKEWVSFTQPENINDEFISGACSAYSNVIDKMQELEGEDDL